MALPPTAMSMRMRMRVRTRMRMRMRMETRMRIRMRLRVRMSDARHQRLHPIVATGVVEMVVRRQHLP